MLFGIKPMTIKLLTILLMGLLVSFMESTIYSILRQEAFAENYIFYYSNIL